MPRSSNAARSDLACLDEQAEPSSGSCPKDAGLPRPATGWQVETEKLVMRRRHGNQPGTAAKLANRVKKITKNSSFTYKQVEELLGEGLTDQPLGDCGHRGSDDVGRASSRHLSRMSDVSFSTCVFGEASEDPVSLQATLTSTADANGSFGSTTGRDPIDDHLPANASTDQLSSRSGLRAISIKRTLRPKQDHVPGRALSHNPESQCSFLLREPTMPDLKNLKESSLLARRISKSLSSCSPPAAASHDPSASAGTIKGPSTGRTVTATSEFQTSDAT